MLESSQLVQVDRHRLLNGAVALTFAPSGNANAPVVFLLHGMGSRKERYYGIGLRLAALGFKACVLDAALHGERATEESALLLVDQTSPAFVATFTRVLRETVTDVARFATELGATAYGIMGHSMGGFITMLTALQDPRAQAIVSIAGAIDVYQAALDSRLPPAAVLIAEQFDPIRNAARLAPRPVLLLHGEQDTVVPAQGSRRLYDTLQPLYQGNAERVQLVVYPAVGHELADEMMDRSLDWMRQYLLM